jgi:hypothetical protein
MRMPQVSRANVLTIACLAFLGLLVVLGLWLNYSLPGAPLPAQQNAPSAYEVEKLIDAMVQVKIVTKIEGELGQGWVSQAAWISATFDEKRAISYALARYIAQTHGRRYLRCEIIDDHTGKRLAKVNDYGFAMDY